MASPRFISATKEAEAGSENQGTVRKFTRRSSVATRRVGFTERRGAWKGQSIEGPNWKGVERTALTGRFKPKQGLLGFEGDSHLLENKTLAALDKSISKCIFNLCKIRAHTSWPEHALFPIGGAESAVPCCRRSAPCGAASAIRVFAASKTESNASGTGS